MKNEDLLIFALREATAVVAVDEQMNSGDTQ